MDLGSLVVLLKLFEGSGLTRKAPPTVTRPKSFFLKKERVFSGKGQGERRDLGLIRFFK